MVWGDIDALPLKGIPSEGRARRVHGDRGTEWTNTSFRNEMQKRHLVHSATQGYALQSNGTAERSGGLMKTTGPRMLAFASLDTNCWPWTLECVRLRGGLSQGIGSPRLRSAREVASMREGGMGTKGYRRNMAEVEAIQPNSG